MSDAPIRFDDGAAYERFMGVWSRLAGETFLDWLAPGPGLRWLDVGCGNGAFTARILERCAPLLVHGIDPSAGQLRFARDRLGPHGVKLLQGDAMDLPFQNQVVDVAVMPLVIFFVPDPTRGVSEMVRVVSPGGVVAAYAWDMPGDGFPYFPLQTEMRALDLPVLTAPSPEASGLDALRDRWTACGLTNVETCEIVVHRTFRDFEDYWTTVLGGPSVGSALSKASSAQLDELKRRLLARHPPAADGTLTCEGRANAVRGQVEGAL